MREGLLLAALGVSGMVVAFLLSLAGSGSVVERDIAVEVVGEKKQRAYELLGISGVVAGSKVELSIRNKGPSGALIELNGKRAEVAPGEIVRFELDSMESYISISWLGEKGVAEVSARVAVREGIRPALSLLAMLVLIISMVVATAGIIEIIVMRKSGA